MSTHAPWSGRVACVISSLRPATGNAITAQRIATQLAALGLAVVCIDCEESHPVLLYGSESAVSRLKSVLPACEAVSLHDCAAVVAGAVDVLVCVHAFRGGQWSLSPEMCMLPTIIVLGGTDMHEYAHPGSPLHSHDRRATILRVLTHRNTRAIVAFTRALATTAERLLSEARDANAPPSEAASRARVFLVPQAVDVADIRAEPHLQHGGRDDHDAVHASPLYASMDDSLDLECGCACCRVRASDPSGLVLLCVCGLRRVKDPLFMLPALTRLREQADGTAARVPVHLLLVGAPLESDVTASVRACPSVTYTGEAPRRDVLRMVRHADVVVSTSVSEGMSNVLMEAMCLGTPVVARRNEGNAELLAGDRLGVCVDTPEDMLLECLRLYGAPVPPHGRLSELPADWRPRPRGSTDRLTAHARTRTAAAQEYACVAFSMDAERRRWRDVLQHALPA